MAGLPGNHVSHQAFLAEKASNPCKTGSHGDDEPSTCELLGAVGVACFSVGEA